MKALLLNLDGSLDIEPALAERPAKLIRPQIIRPQIMEPEVGHPFTFEQPLKVNDRVYRLVYSTVYYLVYVEGR